MNNMLSITLLLSLALAASSTSVAAQTGELTVTATYTGKGKVDDTHEILVFLFDHPNPTAASEPIAMLPLFKSGGSVTFKGLPTQPVYVTLVYDEKANYSGEGGPPPEGTPIGAYAKAKKPISVTPGANVKIVATFDDSRRFK
jgi:hypothetical protein